MIYVTQSTRVSAFNVWSTHRPPLRPWSVADVTLTVFGLQINDTFCNYSENQSHASYVLCSIHDRNRIKYAIHSLENVSPCVQNLIGIAKRVIQSDL